MDINMVTKKIAEITMVKLLEGVFPHALGDGKKWAVTFKDSAIEITDVEENKDSNNSAIIDLKTFECSSSDNNTSITVCKAAEFLRTYIDNNFSANIF